MKKLDGSSKPFVEYKQEQLAAQPRLVNIADAGASPVCGSLLELSENQKRWVVTGVCLNKVLNPVLRTFIEPHMRKQYNAYKTNHNIHNQLHPTRLRKDGSKTLNYESVNNNHVHKRNVSSYDYKVASHVDFAKLYLQTHMAKFSGFDESCDASATLSLLCEVPSLNPIIHGNARDVRMDVRNEWGHCNFAVWDEPKFLVCFQKMETLVRSLGLSKKRTDELVDEMNDWILKGMKLCMGSYVDKDLIQILYQELAILAKYTLDTSQELDTQLKKICDQLNQTLLNFGQRLSTIENQQRATEDTVRELADSTSSIQDNTANMNKNQEDLINNQCQISSKLDQLELKQENVAISLNKSERRQDQVEKTVEELKVSQVELTKNQNELDKETNLMKKGIADVDKKVEKIQETLADREVHPPKVLFQAPNRNKFFCGRKTELERLKRILNVSVEHQLVGICGLGGCGKTTLANEFSWRSRNRYPGGVFWISVENDTLFRNTVTELAFQLQTFHNNFEECLRATLTSLSAISLPWLLVVDNADQLEIGDHLRKLLCGHWKRESKGHFLITTRRSATELCDAIDIEEAQCVTIPCFKIQDAEEFLLKRTEIPMKSASHNQEKQAAIRLIEELGGLPLALEQAAAHIKALGNTFHGYLDKYNKQKLFLLQQKKAKPPSEEISKERLAVHTTWLLNFDYAAKMARDCGLEEAIRLTIDASAFLAPDDIPWEIINQGSPNINLGIEDNQDRGFPIAQLTDILTKFSLFQSGVDGTFCLHRLVQQVVLSRLNNSRRKDVLQCTIRMINFAFEHSPDPEQLLKSEASVNLGQHPLECQRSLAMWAKLASHATVVKGHLADYIESCPSAQNELFYCVESANLMQQTALFFSMNNLQTEALHSQKQLLAIVAGLDQQDHDVVSLFVKGGIKIPLKDDQQQLLLLHSRSYPETSHNNEKVSSDELRQAGNVAYKNQDYDKAIRIYSKALEVNCKQRGSAVDQAVLLANRAQCCLKLNKAKEAVEDANECVRKDPKSWKGYCRRAIAMSMLADAGEEEYRMASIASASMAAHLNPSCRNGLGSYFPNGIETLLLVSLQCQFEEAFRPFLLQSPPTMSTGRRKGFFLVTEGKYHFPEHCALGSSNADLVIFGEGEVEIDLSHGELRDSSRFHFENVSFNHANFLAFNSNGSVFNSILKNGCQMAIDEQRKARHDPMCKDCLICQAKYYPFSDSTLHEGLPSLGLSLGSRVIIQNCDISNAAGGILVTKEGSKAVVSKCVIHKHCLSALEARDGGSLHAKRNTIHSTQWDGICIGPQAGQCVVENNKINGNASHGIQVFRNSGNVTIKDNCVYQNGQHGVCLKEECLGTIRANTIFENWFWGIYISDGSCAAIDNNEIHNNKCGGVRLESNLSSKVLIVKNVIRDHTGPDICHSDTVELTEKRLGLEVGALKLFTSPPILHNNQLERNNEGQQHPKSLIASLGSRCGYCHQIPEQGERVFVCSKCRKLRYCSKDCQVKHWKTHKPFCSALVGSFSVVIDAPKLGKQAKRVFHSALKGIGTGKKPYPKSKRRFIIKVQIQECYARKPDCELVIYDQSTELDFTLQNETLFHIIAQCGVLGCTMLTGKEVFCYAAFEDNGEKLRVFFDELAPFQDW